MNAVTPQVTVECAVRAGDRLGETPLWCGLTQRLLWIDIEKPRLQSFDPATGRHEATPVACDWLGTHALCRPGGGLLGLDL
jgi:sugar lactone lactonase YvrE